MSSVSHRLRRSVGVHRRLIVRLVFYPSAMSRLLSEKGCTAGRRGKDEGTFVGRFGYACRTVGRGKRVWRGLRHSREVRTDVSHFLAPSLTL